MPIERSQRRVSAGRLDAIARELLEASTLIALATVTPGGRAHANTAYFAWSERFDVIWLSEPNATHSRNLRANGTVAASVYDSNQSWARPDRGIQLFGAGRELPAAAARDATQVYAARFPEYQESEFRAYRFYRLRPTRVKLFDEDVLGAGVFVTASVTQGRLAWVRTEVYRERSSS
jgi:uncharacterized protein YhbP (UPF0306 family)